MKSLLTNCFILSFLILLPALTLAEEEKPLTLEEIVVTATRYEEKLTNVPSNVTFISEEDIQNSTAQNIPDLLRNEVGIYVNDIMGNRRTFTVDLRGFGETAASNTLVLVDGRRVNQVDLSGVDWTQIPLERVKRVEVIRGGRGSVLYGDNATGGVINIITKERDKFKAGGVLTSGSYDTFNSNAYVGSSVNNLSFYASGQYYTSDGYRENSDTESKDLGLNACYDVGDFMKLHFSSGYHKDNTGFPGALLESDFAKGFSRTDSKYPKDFLEVEDYFLKISPEIYLLKYNIFKIDASFRKRSWLSFASGSWGNFLGDSEIETWALSPRIIFKNDLRKEKNTLILGVDYQRAENDVENRSLFLGVTTKWIFDMDKKNYGYYVHDEINIGDILYLSVGYRHDRAEFTFPIAPNRISIDEDLYTAGINYIFYQKSFIYLSYSKSFRYPLLDEFYSFYTNTFTKLVPQTSDNYELGIRYYFVDGVYTHINFFRINTHDEIVYNSKTYSNENVDGLSRRDGIEISLSAKPATWLTVTGSYTYLNAMIEGGPFKGENFPNVPKHKATLKVVSLVGKGFSLALNGVYVGRRPFISDFANDFSYQKGYIVLNGKIQYKWKSLKIFLDINNVLNKEYSEYGVLGGFPVEKAFYPSPERNFLASLTIEI